LEPPVVPVLVELDEPDEVELFLLLPQAASSIAAASMHTAITPYFLMRFPPRFCKKQSCMAGPP
jgi:hypothetical protein